MKPEVPDFQEEDLGFKGKVWAGGRYQGHQQMEAADSIRERV